MIIQKEFKVMENRKRRSDGFQNYFKKQNCLLDVGGQEEDELRWFLGFGFGELVDGCVSGNFQRIMIQMIIFEQVDIQDIFLVFI